MTIETKFKIGDIIQSKYANPKLSSGEAATAFEIIYISSETCSAGTQIFYHCRALFVIKNKWKEDGKTVKDISVADMQTIQHGPRFREDEVRGASEEIKVAINSFIQ